MLKIWLENIVEQDWMNSFTLGNNQQMFLILYFPQLPNNLL